jgi:predicted GTPase
LKKEWKAADAAGREEVMRKFKVVCMIGCTGHGKSTTANSLCGEAKFTVSGGTESETTAFDGVLTRWENKPNEDPVVVIDTPGIGDSQGRDTKHIAEMVVGLKKVGYVHAFLIVMNSEEPRLSEHMQETLKLFS